MDRKTKEFITKDGIKVEIKTYLTGGEMRDLRDVFLKNAEMKMEGDVTKIEGLTGTVVTEAENKAIELAVVSVEGQIDNILSKVLDLSAEDYSQIITEINKISLFGEFAGKKK